jgi:hypothetical protein
VPGDYVDFDGHRIVVKEVDGRRVGRVLVTVVPGVHRVDPEHPMGMVGESESKADQDG